MKTLKIVLGIAVSAICLFLVFRGFHFSDLVSILSQADWFWILPATVLYPVNHFLRSLRWQVLLSPIKKISPLVLFPIMMTGFLLNYLLPARAGEFARAFALTRWTGTKASSAFGSIAAERLTDFFGVLAVMLFTVSFYPSGNFPIKPILTIFSIGSAAIIATFYVVQKKRNDIEALHDGFLKKGLILILNVTEGFSALRSPKKIAGILLLALVIWFNEVLILLTITKLLRLDLSYVQSGVILIGTAVGYMIPGAPGAVGTMEFFGKQALLFLGVGNAEAVSFVVFLHFYQIVLILILGLPCLLKVGFSKQALSPEAAT